MSAWLGIKVGVNFRQTVAYVTDPSGTVCLSQNPTNNFDLPTYSGAGTLSPLTVSGLSFNIGWPAGNYDGSRNRSTSVDPRLAGRQCYTVGTLTCEWQAGDSPGAYKLWAGICDQGNGTGGVVNCQVSDSNGVLTTITSAAALSSTGVVDANSTLYANSAAWAATGDTSGTSLTFNTTDTSNGAGGPLLSFQCTTNSPLAHLAIEYLGSGPAPAAAALALSGNAPAIVAGSVITPKVARVRDRVRRYFLPSPSGLLLPDSRLLLPT